MAEYWDNFVIYCVSHIQYIICVYINFKWLKNSSWLERERDCTKHKGQYNIAKQRHFTYDIVHDFIPWLHVDLKSALEIMVCYIHSRQQVLGGGVGGVFYCVAMAMF